MAGEGRRTGGGGPLLRRALPLVRPGLRIGLLGGSFDPPHAGHLHISRQALARFGLDRVWWLVSPGNPLKPESPAAFERRLAACRALARDPRILVSDLERRLGTRHTARTLAGLQRIFPGVRFVWLMGADNLAQLHRWRDWPGIMGRVPVGVLARPGYGVSAGLSPAARRFARARIPAPQARALPLHPPPAWCLVTGPTMRLSSTGLRERGLWPRGRDDRSGRELACRT